MDMETLMKMFATAVTKKETSTDENEHAKSYMDGYNDGYNDALEEINDYEEEETDDYEEEGTSCGCSCGCSCEKGDMPAIVVGASDLADLKRAVATIEKMLGR